MPLTKEIVEALTVEFPETLDLGEMRDLIGYLCGSFSSPRIDIEGTYNLFNGKAPEALSNLESGIYLKDFTLFTSERNVPLIRLALIHKHSSHDRTRVYAGMREADLEFAPHMYNFASNDGFIISSSGKESFERTSTLMSQVRTATEKYFAELEAMKFMTSRGI